MVNCLRRALGGILVSPKGRVSSTDSVHWSRVTPCAFGVILRLALAVSTGENGT